MPGAVERSSYMIRGQKVMLDLDLAETYGVGARALRQAVHRNRERFPADFMFQLTDEEASDIGRIGCRRPLPNAFTAQGVLMLSGLLKGKRAASMSVFIMRGFVKDAQEIRGTDEPDASILLDLVKDIQQLKAPVRPIGSGLPKRKKS